MGSASGLLSYPRPSLARSASRLDGTVENGLLGGLVVVATDTIVGDTITPFTASRQLSGN